MADNFPPRTRAAVDSLHPMDLPNECAALERELHEALRGISDVTKERDDNGRKLTRERRDAGDLANAVGRYINGGCNDEEGLQAALSKWSQYVDVEAPK